MKERHGGGVVHPVVIIGAGVAGLAVACEFQRRGVAPVILDAAPRIAESWRQRHPQLRLNTHRRLSWLPGLRMPADAGAFPSRDDVVRYLEAYEWLIERPIDFGVRVGRIGPEDGHWRLDTSLGPIWTAAVVVATGRERVPFVPDWPGRESFMGELIQAAELGDVERYAGRRVLVVGAGTSGSDVLNHLAAVDTAELMVSVRHGPAVIPTWLAGVPIQLLSPIMSLLPPRLLDRMFALTQRLRFGDLRRHGLASHPDGAATRLLRDGVGPAFDLGFVDALKRGRIRAVPAVRGLQGPRVELADGSPVYPDVVICATGYRPGLEPMVGHLDVLDARGYPRVHGEAGASALGGLHFAGMSATLPGYFHAARRESRAIARALTATQGRATAHSRPTPAGGTEARGVTP